MRVLVEGLGAVGARAVRQLVERGDVEQVLLTGGDEERLAALLASCAPKAARAGAEPLEVDAVVLAGAAGTHGPAARRHVAANRPVVSVSDDVADVRALLDLDAEARARGLAVVVGAGFAPGLSCLLARRAALALDSVDEVHVAVTGAGGPSCARHAAGALTGSALEWRDLGWTRRPAGIGRDRCWFPDPVGGRDCYPAARPDPLLLVPAFPTAARVTVRQAASLGDRLAARLRLPARAAPEGAVGALRVEVRGSEDGRPETVVLGALDRPAVAAGAVAALAAAGAVTRDVPVGAAGLAALADPRPMLGDLAACGVKAAEFTGA